MILFGKQKVMTIDELNAYRVAYGNPLMKKEIFTALGVPFIVCFFAVFILTYYWWLALIAGLVGVAYGYFVLIQISIKRIYHQEALLQRNRFINNMTQLLTDKNITPLTALEWCAQENISTGEFKKDIDQLIGDLMDAGTTEEIKAAYEILSEKYKRDFVFKLYMDLMVTIALEGRSDVKKVKELKSWHNDVIEQTNIFMKNKVGFAQNFKMTTLYTVAIVAVLTFSMGFASWLKNYAHHPIGWICSAILLGGMAFFFHSFQQKMADDEIMEVKIWSK